MADHPALSRLNILSRHLTSAPASPSTPQLERAGTRAEEVQQRPAPGGGKGTLTVVDNRSGKRYTVSWFVFRLAFRGAAFHEWLCGRHACECLRVLGTGASLTGPVSGAHATFSLTLFLNAQKHTHYFLACISLFLEDVCLRHAERCSVRCSALYNNPSVSRIWLSSLCSCACPRPAHS
jgi:hypothetical protein